MVISLIRMLIDGPDVSLNGSPTVSPTTAALWQAHAQFPDTAVFRRGARWQARHARRQALTASKAHRSLRAFAFLRPC